MTFLQNSWYCAGWSDQVTQTPEKKIFLNQPIMIYRATAGHVVALSNRCPHRFAPLHRGKLVDDVIECPYHGLKFDQTGQCVFNPHGDGRIPKAAHLQSFPVLERDGVVWIWMGEASKADPALLPDTDFMHQTDRYAIGTGHMIVNANYQLVTDNLLDLMHAPYLHPETVGGRSEDSVGMQVRFSEDERSISSDYFQEHTPVTVMLRNLFAHPTGDFRIGMRWFPAGNLVMRLSMTPHGQEDGSGFVQPMLHLLTPIDDTHTHYFYAVGRNVARDNKHVDELVLAFVKRAFETEDGPMIAACQEQMGTTDLFSLQPVLLTTDAGNVKARRRLQSLIEQEQRPA